jgi:hypothetical protein
MASQFLIAPDGAVTHYTAAKAAKQAQESTPDSVLVSSEGDLANVPGKVLLLVYNKTVEGEPLTKLKGNKGAQAAAVFEVLPQAAGLPARKAKTSAKGEASEDAGSGKERAPRSDGFKGKTLTVTDEGKIAKRRADTRRSQNFAIISGAKGGKITYEKYIEAGGSAADLVIMQRLGHVTAS